MSVPFYVSPEQLIRDKADYARKGIARGRSVVTLQYADGILFVAENPSRALHKISEIYDSIAFGAVGKYNEFENLRVTGVRLADLRGYAFDRSDVSGRSLANAYAQMLGTVFTEMPKPYEVEIVVAEVGVSSDQDVMYRLTFDGSVADEQRFVAMGGAVEPITEYLSSAWEPEMDLPRALRVAIDALSRDVSGASRVLPTASIEAATLDRNRPRRKFHRLPAAELETLLGSTSTQD